MAYLALDLKMAIGKTLAPHVIVLFLLNLFDRQCRDSRNLADELALPCPLLAALVIKIGELALQTLGRLQGWKV